MVHFLGEKMAMAPIRHICHFVDTSTAGGAGDKYEVCLGDGGDLLGDGGKESVTYRPTNLHLAWVDAKDTCASKHLTPRIALLFFGAKNF